MVFHFNSSFSAGDQEYAELIWIISSIPIFRSTAGFSSFHWVFRRKSNRKSIWLTGSGLKTFPDLYGWYNRNENDTVYIRPNNQPSGYYFQNMYLENYQVLRCISQMLPKNNKNLSKVFLFQKLLCTFNDSKFKFVQSCSSDLQRIFIPSFETSILTWKQNNKIGKSIHSESFESGNLIVGLGTLFVMFPSW